jgi:hypothetical protein
MVLELLLRTSTEMHEFIREVVLKAFGKRPKTFLSFTVVVLNLKTQRFSLNQMLMED